MKAAGLLLLPIILLSGCAERALKKEDKYLITNDSHVHIMSPALVKQWQDMGIPFSHADEYYSNIDTILANVGTGKIDLIGMAYVYGSPEFYQGADEYDLVKKENDVLKAAAAKHPDRVTPYFAVDPLADYAMEEIKRCHEILGMNALKLHFSASEVYLTVMEHLQKIKPVFHYAADNKLPILLHFDNWHPKFGEPDINILIDSILQDIPAITLRIAHFGTSGGFNAKTKAFLNTFITVFEQQRIPERHTILFDISAVALDKDSEGVSKLTTEEFAELATYIRKLGVNKIVFGTDYPLYKGMEYRKILQEKVALTDEELKQMK